MLTFTDGSSVTGGNVFVVNPELSSTAINNVGFNGAIPAGSSAQVFFRLEKYSANRVLVISYDFIVTLVVNMDVVNDH